MKHTINFTVLEDDGLFEGHELELVYDDDKDHMDKMRAFESIRSVGKSPLSTNAVTQLVELCVISEEIHKAIQEHGQFSPEELTLGAIEDVCTEVATNPYIVLDSDYNYEKVA